MNPKSSPVSYRQENVAVFGAPGRYIQGAGAIEMAGPIVASLGRQAVVVTDPIVRELVGDRLAAILAKQGLGTEFLLQDGDLLQSSASDLLRQRAPRDGDVVLACGGGRAIDTGKALVELYGAPLVTIPTVASNDAPTSKNFVLYDDRHRIVEVRHLARSPDFVLVDTAIIAAAPREYLAYGLGDALAKLPEADACQRAGGRNMFGGRPTALARSIAAACNETLLMRGEGALAAAGTGEVTEDLEACVEALILMAGLAFESGGLSIAHALTRGLPLIPEILPAPHGLQVAYGTMVQRTLEGGDPDPRLVPLMKKAGLPICFRDLAGRPPATEDFRKIAEGTMGVPHLDNFPRRVSETDLVAAMQALETDQLARPV